MGLKALKSTLKSTWRFDQQHTLNQGESFKLKVDGLGLLFYLFWHITSSDSK